MPTFTGTTGADELIGSEGDDVIDGRGGADRIYGRSGNDRITGVLGAVEVYGGSGDDTVTVGYIDGARPPFTAPITNLIDGGDGFDTLVFDSTGVSPDYFMRIRTIQNEPDTLSAALQDSPFSGGAIWLVSRINGFERIIGANVATEWSLGGTPRSWDIVAGSGADSFFIEVGSTASIRGGGGNDLFGVTAGSQLYGEDGDDVFSFGDGSASLPTLLDGGAGSDTLRATISIPFGRSERSFSLADGTRDGVTYRSIENLSITLGGASSTDNVVLNITGTDAANTIRITHQSRGFSTGEIRVGAGNDIVESVGTQTVYGGDGNDQIRSGGVLYGEAGDDILIGGPLLFGGDGNDTMQGSVANGGQLDGGNGIDTLSILDVASATLVISLADGTTARTSPDFPVQRGSIASIERLITGVSTDTIIMRDGHEYVQAGGGADQVRAGNGNDIIYGDDLVAASTDGADLLYGEAGDDLIFGGGGNDQLFGGLGDDVLIGGTGNNILDGGSGGQDLAVLSMARSSATITYSGSDIRIEGLTGAFDILRGIESIRFNDGVYDIVDGQVATQGRGPIAGTAGNDRLTGTAAADILSGGAGNDILRGGAGSDFIDGGAGIDTARYGGTIRSYATVSTSVVMGGEEGGTDLLTGIEVLQFLDGRLSFDTSDATTVVYRLYDAAFDRAPDVFGLADYSRAISEGRQTVQQILDIFAGSLEFRARYGALNNDEFVREMYRFSLNREGDAGGVATYVAALNAGTVTRSQLLGIFSESQEHQAQINAIITSQGLFVQDEQTASVARLYDSVFNRLPDLGGLRTYREGLDQGYTLRDIATAMVGSPEFQSRFGNLTNQQFVEQLYRFVLDREGDAAGVQTYVSALNNGATNRVDLVLIFSDSLEHRISYQATYDSQIRRLGVNGYDPNGTGGLGVVVDGPDKHGDAFVLPAGSAFDLTGHHDDAVAVLEAAANDHVPTDDALVGPWMLTDPTIGTDDLSSGHHRSDWM